jgi:hypothetical protein
LMTAVRIIGSVGPSNASFHSSKPPPASVHALRVRAAGVRDAPAEGRGGPLREALWGAPDG